MDKNLKSICRVCLVKNSSSAIHSLTEQQTQKMLFECTSVWVSTGDGYPQQMCGKCWDRCMSWVDFKAIAQESERRLKTELDISMMLEQLLDEEVEEETDRTQQPRSEEEVMATGEYEIALVKEEQPPDYMEGHSWTAEEDDDVDELPFDDPLEYPAANQPNSEDTATKDKDTGGRSTTPDHIKARLQRMVSDGAVPAKSRKSYMAACKKYVQWKEQNQVPVSCNSESVIEGYINSLVGSIVPTSLWVTLSMIRSHVLIETGEMVKTPIVNAIIKSLCDGYTPKQPAVLTQEQFGQFLLRASDDNFTMQKAIIAIGLSGALRKCEIYDLKFGDVKHLEGAFLISIPKSRANTTGSFVVTTPKDSANPVNYYAYLERYHRLRLALEPTTDPYIMQVRNGKCTRQRVGTHSIARIPKMVATYLGLENPKSFTGHSFKRSSN